MSPSAHCDIVVYRERAGEDAGPYRENQKPPSNQYRLTQPEISQVGTSHMVRKTSRLNGEREA